MKRWYVVQLKSKQEELAEDSLVDQGFQVYYPKIIEARRYKGEQVNVMVPLFAGYMFVRFDIDADRWRAIAHTKGVYNLLTATEDRCTALPQGFIEELIKQEKDGVVAENTAVQHLRDFVIGEELQIDNGVFKGFSGICERVNKDRVVILLSLLGGNTKVELPKASVTHCP